MPRIRSIKPQFWLDEELGNVKRDARLLYIGLWNLCDDRGVFEYKPGKIRVQLFPYDVDMGNGVIKELLNILEKSGHFLKFSEKGEDFGYIKTFLKHQEIKKPSKWSFTTTLPDTTNTPLVTHQLPTSSEPVTGSTLKEKEKEKEKIKGKDTTVVFVLPDWVNKETWDDFMEVRKLKKAVQSLRAKQLLIKDLENFKAAGDDPNEVLNRSIKNSWKGLFPLKDGRKNGAYKASPGQPRKPEEYTDPAEFRKRAGW
jgi:hypothetical protein